MRTIKLKKNQLENLSFILGEFITAHEHPETKDIYEQNWRYVRTY